ncbi:MAG TPA: cadherin-like domain-containing protein [Verrucomicrobiae bacterium]|jgi:hypothetical protein
MKKLISKVLGGAAFWLGTCLLHAQSSNNVWFVTWNGQPTPGSDISVQSISANGSGSATSAGTAVNFVSQTNFPAFNSPYDIAVDPVLGKVYVLDNNIQGGAPEYIYSFNLTGTPTQIAASAQIIYTMPVPSADVIAGVYPLVSGLALDPVTHNLYFNQIDVTTATNSYIGRLSLTNSGASGLQMLYVGQVPGQGTIAVGSTNIYVGAINSRNGNNGVFTAPVSGSGAFSEIATVSAGDMLFRSGCVSGVASDSADQLVYYLTFNAGELNHQYNLSQNAVWVYNTVTHVTAKIASGYAGYPNNIAVDPVNHRYYFTIGRDGTGNASMTNYQAIYTGVLGTTNAPALFYKPVLSGQDAAGQANAGNVALQGIYIQDIVSTNPPVAGGIVVAAQKNLSLTLLVTNLLAYDSDPAGNTLSITAVNGASGNGGTVSLSSGAITYTPSANFTGTDQFTYTLADNGGGQAQGTVTVNVLALNPPPMNTLSLTMASSSRLLLFKGNVGQSCMFQYANVLAGPWYTFSPSVITSGAGLVEYCDLTTGSASTRFYRVTLAP